MRYFICILLDKACW